MAAAVAAICHTLILSLPTVMKEKKGEAVAAPKPKTKLTMRNFRQVMVGEEGGEFEFTSTRRFWCPLLG